MISLISDNYNLLQSLGCFGINLGFGDKTVDETCIDNNVDTHTFLAVVNFTANGGFVSPATNNLSVPTLLRYLEASHRYYLEFQLPRIRQELTDAIDCNANMGVLILKLYDDYAREIRRHMLYEERVVFPYVENLIKGEMPGNFTFHTFAQQHSHTDTKITELKTLILKYLPSDSGSNNKLIAALHHLYNHEVWLKTHCRIEDHILLPAIQQLENKISQSNVSRNIAHMFAKGPADAGECLTERERDVLVALVQGMSNKQIAAHLFISTNTVITHRRNIARKLQIHSEAGLTIYAIASRLVDISTVKL